MELMVVIAIMGILACMAFPQFDRVMQRQKLNNEARHLAGEMRLARQEAITTGIATRVEFYYFASCYEVKNKPRHYFPTGISYKAKPTFVHPNSPRIYCIFAPSGVPSPGGTVCLTNLNQDLVYIIVNLPAGRVRISDQPPE